MEQMRIVKEMREASEQKLKSEFGDDFNKTKISPRYMVWENVCHCGTTLITTSTGYKYIKDVEVGELVRTHDGTYHRVLQTYKTEMQPTIKVMFQGGTVECTPNHPFLTEELTYKPIGEFKVGDRVAFKVDDPGTKSIGMPIAYAFGRWLADGSVAIRNDRKTKHRIFISTGYKKYEGLKAELSKLPYHINENKMDWAINFTFSSDEFGELTDSAGYGARNKQVPEWVFELVAEEQAEVLRGYLAGDGYQRIRSCNHTECVYSTASEKLAYGVARLIRAVHHVGVSVRHIKGAGTVIIEGREVSAHDYWVCSFSMPSKYEHNLKGTANASKYADGYIWCCIKDISEGEIQDVYNLSVEDNNTYEANGVICHNCGAFSSGTPGGSDFQAVLEEICKVVRHECPPVPIPKDGWSSSGNLDGVGDDGTPFSICWRLHDAQYWGVPQRRRRIALVADFGGTSASEILFESYGLSGNPEQSAKTRERTPRDSSDSLGETGKEQVEDFISAVNEDAKHQQDLLQSDLGVARTLACGTHASGPHLTKTLGTGGALDSKSEVTAICIGNGQVDNATTPDVELSKTLNCMSDPMKVLVSPTSDVVNVETEVSVRKYEVDVPKLIECLQAHRKNMSIKELVKALDKPKTLVEHWFRQDKYFAIPDADIWMKLKELLKIDTDEFDESIMTFETKAGVFDTSNRIHIGEVTPTLTASGENTMYCVKQNPHAVCYGISAYDSNAMKSDNPNSGFYEADSSRTLDLNGGNPACNQGGMAIVQDTAGDSDSLTDKPKVYEWYRRDTRVTELGDVCSTVQASYGSGGNNMPYVVQPGCKESTKSYGVTTKGNGDAFISEERHTSLSTGGGDAGQGYPCILTTDDAPDKCLNPWDIQSKHIQPEDDIAESLYSGECRYGGGESYVLQKQNDSVCGGFMPRNSSDAHSIGYEDEKSPTLTIDQNYAVVQKEPVLLESSQNHATVQTNGVSTTLTASMGEGGGYVPMIVDEQNRTIKQEGCDVYNHTVTGEVAVTVTPDCGNTNTIGPKILMQGLDAYNQASTGDVAMPLTNAATDPHHIPCVYGVTTEEESSSADATVVAYGLDSYNQDISLERSQTLKVNIGDDSKAKVLVSVDKSSDDKPNMVVLEGNGSRDSHKGDGYSEADVMYTLNTVEQHAVAYSVPENSVQDSNSPKVITMTDVGFIDVDENDLAYTLRARDYKTPPTVCIDDSNANMSYCIGNGQYGQLGLSETVGTLDCMHDQKAVITFEPGAASRVGGHIYTDDVSGTVRSNAGDNQQAVVYCVDQAGGKSSCHVEQNITTPLATTHDGAPVVLSVENHPNDSRIKISPDGVVQTLSRQMGTGGNNTPMVIDMLNLNPNTDDKSMTLNAYNGTGGNNMPLVLNCKDSQTSEVESDDLTYQKITGTLDCGIARGTQNQTVEQNMFVANRAIVRRLTPLECTRLQGFPDGWCDIGDWVDSQGKKHKDSDSPKYKALGNSIALPFWDWMADRMVAQLKKSGVANPTMASLFDGIAGFPYVYVRHGCMPLWASEIEEYPIAICKKHFGDEKTGEVGDIEEYLKLPPNWVTKQK